MCYEIGMGDYNVLFLSCIHGNEVGGAKLTSHLANWLNKNIEQFPNLKIFIIPVLNPDGYEEALSHPDYLNWGRIGRFNTRNVDMNRNFDTKSFSTHSIWSRGNKYQEREEVYCGEHGNSEPEIQALTTFLFTKNVKLWFSYHSVGADMITARDPLSEQIGKIYSNTSGFRLDSHHVWLKYDQTGTAKEWSEEHGISFIEVENSNRYGSDWKVQKNGIAASLKYLNEMRAV